MDHSTAYCDNIVVIDPQECGHINVQVLLVVLQLYEQVLVGSATTAPSTRPKSGNGEGTKRERCLMTIFDTLGSVFRVTSWSTLSSTFIYMIDTHCRMAKINFKL